MTNRNLGKTPDSNVSTTKLWQKKRHTQTHDDLCCCFLSEVLKIGCFVGTLERTERHKSGCEELSTINLSQAVTMQAESQIQLLEFLTFLRCRAWPRLVVRPCRSSSFSARLLCFRVMDAGYVQKPGMCRRRYLQWGVCRGAEFQ